jgi:hypothetical protein
LREFGGYDNDSGFVGLSKAGAESEVAAKVNECRDAAKKLEEPALTS